MDTLLYFAAVAAIVVGLLYMGLRSRDGESSDGGGDGGGDGGD